MRSKLHSYTEAILRQSRFPNEYWSAIKRLRVWGSNDYSFRLQTNRAGYHESCPLFRVLRYRAPSSTICLSEVLKQALRLIARILLIQRKGKYSSREEKRTFPQWFSSVYVRSLKDRARQSKYPRTQILEPRTQPKLFCHSSATFIPMRSNNLSL